MMQSLALILAVSLAILLAFLMLSQRETRKFFLSQLTVAQNQNQELRQEIQRLTNLLSSKDPMTYYTLQQSSMQETLKSEPYQGTGSDEAEFQKWAAVAGVDTETYHDDLQELGFNL